MLLELWYQELWYQERGSLGFARHLIVEITRRLALLAMMVLVPSKVLAGELLLLNHDVLTGELFAVEATHVIWASAAIGSVSVPKEAIAGIYSSVPLKVYGVDEPCYWRTMEGRDVVMECGESLIIRRALRSLQNVVLYQSYRVAGYQWNGTVRGVGTASSGNKNQKNWLLDVAMVLRHQEYRHLMGGKYESESLDDGMLAEEYELTYGLDLFFSRRTFWFVDSSAARDETRDIEARYTAGSGIGYQFWDTNKSALSIQTGGEYVEEKISDDQVPADKYVSWRLSSSYRYLLPRSMAFYAKADFLQSVSDSDDWAADAEAGMSMPVAMGISTDIKVEFDYDNTPAEAFAKQDTALRVGFGYQW